MNRSSILAGLLVLIAMQIVGQAVLWPAIWDSGSTDARLMSALWWAWTIIQIALAVPVGIHLVRLGLIRFGAPRAADRLPTAWLNSPRVSASKQYPASKPRSAMLSA